MAEHQHIHQHYHHIEPKSEVPFWQVAVLYIILLAAIAEVAFFIAALNHGQVFWFFFVHFMLFGVPAGIYYGIKYLVGQARDRADYRRKLGDDALKQHDQVMSGDDSGIYGNYPPAC
ncbi:hypothetical protein ABW16_12155 [Mycolicibacter heraklionensis]|uniref:Uncharacterized protein n=1 Tax=Mycolicibacter heraklionensis TaxID=512402 RepID=A0ABR5FEM1_9MYCO|nr:hypothetical protein [Mycolicibacter heraklionensis]KLO28459.1 hypothetical protein ABW16_12155 [Mycolicibacter heraklionensis]